MEKRAWTRKQIQQHREAAENLCEIKDQSFELMRVKSSISEYEVAEFVLEEFKKRGMRTDYDVPIVAFRENTSFVHYFPQKKSAKRLKTNSLIMLDIWARMNKKNAPFADITWMAWKGGDIPQDIQKGFKAIIISRDSGLDYIRKSLKDNKIKNKDISLSMTSIVLNSGMQDFIPHGFGHSLGTISCHGKRGRLIDTSGSLLIKNVAYTIEPGIYIEGKYGFRSEIDFYVDEKRRLQVTTEVQKRIVRI